MGWQDRSYYRDPQPSYSNPLAWLWYGRIPLFTVFGIRVQAHPMLLIAMLFILLFGWGRDKTVPLDRVIAAGALFVIVLLHEFGHCFAARWMGGFADEIVMHPLGGLALAQPPRRPWPTFVTVAGGPLVNVIICAVTGIVLYLGLGQIPWNPINPSIDWNEALRESYNTWGRWVWWTYTASWSLLLFNLLPIYPLDGGQMLQTILWPRFGYFKSMVFACTTGMVGCGVGFMWALATANLGLAILAVLGFLGCYQMRRMVVAAGPYAFGDEDSGVDYSASVFDEPKSRKRVSQRAIKRQQRREDEEKAEREQVDQILAKVSANGMNSLSWWEKRTLKRATERQRKREVALREEMKQKGF